MPRRKKENKEKDFDDLQAHSEKEESVEIFEVDKNGREEIIETKNTEILNEIPSQMQVANENKTLRNIFITIVLLSASFLIGWFFMSNNDFEYKGITFEVVKEIAPYRTSIPVLYQGIETDYNFYLRNDPRELEKINFDGNLNLKPFMVVNATDSLKCNGDGIISIANIANLYQIIGTQVIKDQNATCNQNGTYMFLNLVEANESRIEQYGPSCYQLSVSNCDVLKVTEKFMVETLAKVEKLT
ncbi:MAG: hypothetical protein AABY03_00685 [Nanoarchaeota archaeon]